MLKLLQPDPAEPPPAPSGSDAPADELRALARAAAAGRRDALQTLTVAIAPALLRTVRGVLGARHPDVEDVLQDALVAVHHSLPEFRGDCRTIHFACRVAVHIAMNARRKAGYRSRVTPSVDPDELDAFEHDERSPAEAHAAARRRAALRELLDELPLVQAEALVLHAVLGYSVEETATATRAPHNTVRSRLRAALSLLRERIEDDAHLLEMLRGDA